MCCQFNIASHFATILVDDVGRYSGNINLWTEQEEGLAECNFTAAFGDVQEEIISRKQVSV